MSVADLLLASALPSYCSALFYRSRYPALAPISPTDVEFPSLRGSSVSASASPTDVELPSLLGSSVSASASPTDVELSSLEFEFVGSGPCLRT